MRRILKRVPDPLRALPGVGPAIASDLRALGYSDPADLVGEEPELMYHRLCDLQGAHVDRCMLYVFRCAVYAASTDRPETEKLKWWNWKD